MNRLAIGHLNLNCFLHKFNSLDIFMISETELEQIFPESQFLMDGFTPPYRVDKNRNGDGIALYDREDIPSRQISFKSDDKDKEYFFCGLHK